MSYLQPLITSAFASYSVSRSAYPDRAPGVTQGDTDNQTRNADGIQPNERVGSTSGSEKTQEAGKTTEKSVDRDAGKPQSASGDVLDLSKDAREAIGAQDDVGARDIGAQDDVGARDIGAQDVGAQDKADATDRVVKELNEQADAEIDEYRASRKQDSDDAETSKIAVDEEKQNLAAARTGSGAAMESASELTPEEQQQVEELKVRDAEVRAHEQQHIAAGGQYVTGGPTYTYQTGPDGQQYAIGGEVSIDVSEVSGDPQATIQKMQAVAAAAMAPAEPSGQDHKVAAAARQTEAKARAELSSQQATEMSGEGEETEEESAVVGAMASEESEEGDEKSEKSDSSEKTSVDAAAPKSSSISVAKENRAASAQSSAYQANSSMTSGQNAGSLFSAFA